MQKKTLNVLKAIKKLEDEGRTLTKKLMLEQVDGVKSSTINALINGGHLKSNSERVPSQSDKGQVSKVNTYSLSESSKSLIEDKPETQATDS